MDKDTSSVVQQSSRSGLWWLWISVIVFAVDQWTNDLASQSLTLYQPMKVNDFLNWTLMHNEGMAFSLLADQSGWQRWGISVVAIVIVLWLLTWLKKNQYGAIWLNLGLCCVIGGALGNIYDRIQLGYVVDFIEAHYNDWYWPAFNVADTAISIGAIFLIIDLIWGNNENQSG